MNKLHDLDRIGFFDLETTGLDVWNVRVVTAAVGVLDNSGNVLSVSSWLINPGVEIPEAASNVHGITNEIAMTHGQDPQSAISEIVGKLREISDLGVPLVAFNAAYDFTIISQEAIRNSLPDQHFTPVFDPLIIDRKFVQKRFGKRTLGDLTKIYSVALENSHSAEADAVAAAQIALAQIRLFSDLAQLQPEEAHNLQKVWADEQATDFERYMQQRSAEFRSERGWPVRKRTS